MSHAVIDIGTNTLILLIGKPKGKKIEVIHDRAIITRLGQGLTDNHFFTSEAMNRTLKALAEFKKTCDEMKIKKIVAVGTAACRTAANAKVFIDAAKKETGIKVDIIPAEEEAEYVFSAAMADFDQKGRKMIVVDIGGGSTEIITGPASAKKKGPESIFSLLMGSVRLTEQYVTTDPITQEEFRRLHTAIHNGVCDELEDFYPKNSDFSKHALIATAGTATTLLAIEKKVANYNPKKIHGQSLKKEALEKIINHLASLTVNQRQKLSGLEPLRADVILAGAMLLNEIMAFFRQNKAVISDRGLRYGVFYKKFMK